jgi:hypothetical protein
VVNTLWVLRYGSCETEVSPLPPFAQTVAEIGAPVSDFKVVESFQRSRFGAHRPRPLAGNGVLGTALAAEVTDLAFVFG